MYMSPHTHHYTHTRRRRSVSSSSSDDSSDSDSSSDDEDLPSPNKGQDTTFGNAFALGLDVSYIHNPTCSTDKYYVMMITTLPLNGIFI